MTVCGIEHADGVCVMGKCPHIKKCCPAVWDKSGKPMTNEEWLRQASTEDVAKWFGNWHSFSCVFCKHWRNGCVYNHNQVRCAIEEGKSNKELWLEWLKQPHTTTKE